MIISNNFNAYQSILDRRYRGLSTCTNAACIRQEAIASFKLVGIILVIVAIIFFYQWLKRQPIQSNETYVNLPEIEIETHDLNQFESGFWLSQYYQYDTWHGPHRLMLLFDPETWKVAGSGSDDVGAYTIDGIYSIKTNRMGLTKTYQKGTGDPQQNLGHNVTIQMAWNSTQHQFEGKWFVQTNKYNGEDKFELKLEKGHRAIQ